VTFDTNDSSTLFNEAQGAQPSSPKILILGGTGMLGHKLFQQLRARFPGTLCTMQQHAADAPYDHITLLKNRGVIEGVDAFDFDQLSKLLLRLRPHFLINCIGVIKQRQAASSHIATITLNSLLPHRLAALSARWGGRLIHFSTDCVFSGRRGMYKEGDPCDPQDLYGKTKFLGETTAVNALTVRTSIIGRELTNHCSLLDWFLSNSRGRVQGYRKSLYSGVTTNHLAELVADIIVRHQHLNGLYQVASEPISKYELLCLLREAYALDIGIDPVDGEAVDRSMDGSKFCEMTGYKCPPWAALVQQLAEDPTPYEEWAKTESLIRPIRSIKAGALV
jgi:dTDP-4-dehydrorhamnose reductase